MSHRSKWAWILAAGLAVVMMGCQQQPSETEQGETQGAKSETKAEGKKGGMKAGQGKKAEPRTVTVPAGTALSVRLADAISSGKASDGEKFEATLAEPLTAEGEEIAGVGSKVRGKVTNAVSAGRLNKPAELSLTLVALTLKGGDNIEISTSTWSEKGESHKKRNTEMIGGGAAAGALIGALTGGKKGAAIGAGVGAGGGTGVAAATGKKEIVLPVETKLTFKLTQPITVTEKK